MSESGKNKCYSDLFLRNQNIISPETQEELKKLRVLVAGCGSVGGAFIEGASRLGVLQYKLAEPDTYDIHNLNRQFVYPSDIGKNKAIVHLERLQNLFNNCAPVITVEPLGIISDTVESLLKDVDLVFDGVDVTTAKGINSKIILHECAFNKKIPVVTSLDLGFMQWIRFYDYRILTEPLDGRLLQAKNCNHPLKVLIEGFCTIEEFSVEILEELIKLLTIPNSSACQLATCCHLLSAFTSPLLIRFCEHKSIPKLITFDSMRCFEDDVEKFHLEQKKSMLLEKARSLLVEIS